jgi:hypothetical protein
MSEAKTTTDHDTIRKWTEARGGRPAAVHATHGKSETGILRIDFPGRGDDSALDEIPWEEFFDKFEKENLAFLYQDKLKDGATSRFFKFVQRDGDEKDDGKTAAKSGGSSGAKSESKTAAKSDGKSSAKSESKTGAKSDAKNGGKAESKSGSKGESKSGAKSEGKGGR